MTTALAVREITPNVINTVMQLAPILKDSRLFGVATVEQAAAICLKGHELGLGFTASLEFIHIVQGKPTLSPRGALAILYQSGQMETIKITDKKKDNLPWSCEVTMKRRGGIEYTIEYTMDDAKRAGLIKTDSAWQSYAGNMLRWRAVGFCIDVVAPDIIGGMKRADEFGALVNSEGDIVEAEWTPAPIATVASNGGPQPAEPQPIAAVTVSLTDLVNRYGAPEIMAANDGKIPATQEELEEVEERLRGK